ncbi:MAG: hypothetical protein OEX00_07985, partial [Gammaproteobacteria bacterium]|nr:hypothetical protein [Gammaproteobacteria bacterium]
MSDSRVRRAGLATASIIGLCLISACSEEDSSESGWSTSKLTSDSESYNAKAQFSGSNHFAVWQSVESREVQAGSEDLPGKTDHYTQSGHLDGHIHMLVKVKPIINMSVGSSGNWGIAKTWSDGDEKNERRISRSTTTNAVVATDEIFGIGFEPETSIATDSAGRAVAIWTELNAGVVNLYSCTYSGGWCATKSAVDTATNSVRNPQIALNSNGDGAAAWEQKENGAWTIYAASYNVGTGFGTPARISGDDGGATLYDAGSPQIAVSGTGVVLAVWK